MLAVSWYVDESSVCADDSCVVCDGSSVCSFVSGPEAADLDVNPASAGWRVDWYVVRE